MKLKLTYRKGLNHKIFLLLMFSTFIGYIGYYIYSKNMNFNVYFLYSNYFLSRFEYIDITSKIFRFAKDGLVILLIASLIVKMKKTQQKLFLLVGIFTVWGVALGVFNGLDITTMVSGVRSYIYFFAIVLFFSGVKDGFLKIESFERVVFLGLIINLVVQVEQAYRGTAGDLSLAGIGGYRFPGLFGGTNGLASFAIGGSLFYFVLDVFSKRVKPIKVVMVFICCVIMTVFTGTRSALINILLIIGAWLVFKIKIKKQQRFWFAVIVAVVALPIIITIATNMAGRGDILQVQLESGRLLILKNLLSNPSLFALLFGYGIGAGSNTDVIINLGDATDHTNILDGTFNVIIYQYGLIGLILVIALLILVFIKLNNCKNLIIKYVVFITIFLQAFTGNIFETHAFLLVLGVVVALLITSKFELSELDGVDTNNALLQN